MSRSQTASTQIDEATCIFGAGVLLKHLAALEEQAAGIRDKNNDIEFIHQARVASRRLRAAVPLFVSCLPHKKARGWQKQMRTVTRALGAARDTDVQIEALEAFAQSAIEPRFKPGINRLLLRLRQKHIQLQAPLSKVIKQLDESHLFAEMRDRLEPLARNEGEVYIFTPVLYQHSFQSISARLDELIAYEGIIQDPQKIVELHEMRIRAKQLRYTLETFAPLYANQLKPFLLAVRKTQEMAGEIHDCDVWQELLPIFLEEERQFILSYFGHLRPVKRLIPGIQAFSEDRRAAREAEYTGLIDHWQMGLASGLWDDLRKTLQKPLFQTDSIYPPAPAAENNPITFLS